MAQGGDDQGSERGVGGRKRAIGDVGGWGEGRRERKGGREESERGSVGGGAVQAEER